MKPLRCVLLAAVLAVPAFAQPSGDHRGQGPGGHRGPPPEALAACEGKTAGTRCSFNHADRAVEGSCFTPGNDLPLACRPEGPPADRER